MLPDVRRPAAEPEPDRDREAGPPRPVAETVVGQAGQALRAEVDRPVEPLAQRLARPGGLDRGFVGQRLVQRLGHARREARVVDVMRVGRPPGAAPAIRSLAVDDVPEGQSDRPLAAAWVGIELVLGEPEQQAVQVPAGRRCGRDDGRGVRLRRLGRQQRARRRLRELERLERAVGAVADLLLAATDPVPRSRQRGLGDGEQVRGGCQDIRSCPVERRGQRAGERVVGEVEQRGVDDGRGGHRGSVPGSPSPGGQLRRRARPSGTRPACA
jgi:hypothetical protein